jgi:hypothetical protein
MKHTIPHGLAPHMALKAAHHAFDAYVARFAAHSPSVSWSGNQADIRFVANGVTLTGRLGVMPSAFELELTVPMLFRMFEGKAVKVIEEEVRAWVEKARLGQLPD